MVGPDLDGRAEIGWCRVWLGCCVTDEHGSSAGAAGADDDGESEPDYRFTLANERTFLAWQRTALGLLAAAVAVVQLLPELGVPGARHLLGGVLAVLAAFTAGAGLRRWQQVDRAMRRGLPLPRHPTTVYLGIGLFGLGVLVLGMVIYTAMAG
jgi:putative membrane protein